MPNRMRPLKTPILGGVIFLVPCIIVLVIFAKAFEVMGLLAAPFGALIPVDSIGGIATANIVTVLAILLVCYLAGLVAVSGIGRRLYQSLAEKLMLPFPRYSFIKSMTESMSPEEIEKTLNSVVAEFGDQFQIAFEVERNEQGLVTVFLPGSPDPWSGTVAHVTAERVRDIGADFATVSSSLRNAGRNAGCLLKQNPPVLEND